jgi:hypothetical protein
MSDTPETDAAADWYLAAAYSTDPEDRTVPLSVSRKLERERNEWAKLCGQYKQERDEAIRHLENHTASTIHSCHDQCQRPMCVLRRERDEAREALENLKASLDQIASLYESKEMTATVCQRISDAYDMRCIARQAIDQLKEGAK